jgi:hypothetical protein
MNGKDKKHYKMTPEQALDKLDKTLIGDLELKIVLTKALEKQIPKKPIPMIDKRTGKRVVSWRCPNPNCDNNCLGGNEYQFDCCEVCGQKLDWEE